MAIAQSMVEYIARKIKCKTLFSTHYHELTFLDEVEKGIKNVHASVTEKEHEIVFMYKIKDGRANKSYGINVARLALLPEEVLSRAEVILKTLEDNNVESKLHEEAKNEVQNIKVVSDVERYLSKMDPLNMSTMEALSALMELKKLQGRD